MNMAKRKYSKMRKIEPSVQTFTFAYQVTDASSQDNYIDLSQVASLVNRRFYRQGINWAVSDFKFLIGATAPASGSPWSLNVKKLPNTWVMSNSWEKGFRAWDKMNKQALEENPSLKPKFLDFKIFADSDHVSAGFVSNLRPPASIAGEWVESRVLIPTSDPADGSVDDFVITAVGDNTTVSKSLIEGYAASRSLPVAFTDPNTPDDALSPAENWMSSMFNDGTQQDIVNLESLTTENDIAPYPFENDGANFDTMYPNGANQTPGLELHDSEYYTDTTISSTVRMGGGNFPCGLIKLEHFGFTGASQQAPVNILLQINLVPGTHRGYLCEPMTEM